MIIEQHYDEEVLIALLDEQKESAARDPHIASCTTCTSALDSIRQVTTALQDDAVWEHRELSEQPKPETRDALRSFAAAVASEDATAEPRVKAMLAKSREEWQPLLDAHPEWRTAGFVRRLIAAVDAINFTSPTDAVELTRITVDVAEALPGDNERLRKLRAGAWREYAYALFYVGSHPEALTAVARAETLLVGCSIGNYELARVALTRALIYGTIERLDEGLLLAASAEKVFTSFGDQRRLTAAISTRASLLMRGGRYSEALVINLRTASLAPDPQARVVATQNAAWCARELGDFEQARALFTAAITDCERAQLVSFKSTAKWNLGRLMMAEGRIGDARRLFEQVRCEFEDLGMAHSVALVCVDLAETLLIQGKNKDIADLCREAMTYFQRVELTYSKGALSALAFIQEAAASELLTPVAVATVRTFFERLPDRPHLLFASPA